MPPRVESFASLSRSIDSTESIKGKSFQTILSSRYASSPSNDALPSAELRSMIEDQADRRGYVTTPTPIEHMPRLSKLSENGPELYVKRDDVSLQSCFMSVHFSRYFLQIKFSLDRIYSHHRILCTFVHLNSLCLSKLLPLAGGGSKTRKLGECARFPVHEHNM